MIKIDWRQRLFASLITEKGNQAIIALVPLKTLGENQKNLDLALEDAYFEKSDSSSKYQIIYMNRVKFIYCVDGLTCYFSEIPKNLNYIKEWLK